MDTLNKGKSRFLPKSVTREQAKDTGMAMVLICLLVWYFFNVKQLFGLALALLITNMVVPQIYKPMAKLWLGLSNLLGAVMSRVLLTVLFFMLVTPIGVLRRVAGKDSLKINKWKKGRESVFYIRDYTYQPKDIDKPY